MANYHSLFGNLSQIEKEHLQKYEHLYNPIELLSEKFKKYKLISAQKDISEKNAPYVHTVANARKTFGNNISVYKLSNEIIERVKETTIDKMPGEIPELYKKPFILEAHDNKSTLFGDIDSILGFYHDFEGMRKTEISSKPRFTFLFHSKYIQDIEWEKSIQIINEHIINTSNNSRFFYLGFSLFMLRPLEIEDYWDFNFVDYERSIMVNINHCDTCIFKKDCNYISSRDFKLKHHLCLASIWDNLLSFVTVFNYMLIAANSPVKEKRSVEHTNYTINKKGKIVEKTEDWITKYIYLDDIKKVYENNPNPSELNKDGLTLKNVHVRRHLKRVAIGTNHAEREWRIIESYPKNIWVKEGDTKIIVGIKNKNN